MCCIAGGLWRHLLTISVEQLQSILDSVIRFCTVRLLGKRWASVIIGIRSTISSKANKNAHLILLDESYEGGPLDLDRLASTIV